MLLHLSLAVSIPHSELTAAILSVKISKLTREELLYSIVMEYFWTDSVPWITTE